MGFNPRKIVVLDSPMAKLFHPGLFLVDFIIVATALFLFPILDLNSRGFDAFEVIGIFFVTAPDDLYDIYYASFERYNEGYFGIIIASLFHYIVGGKMAINRARKIQFQQVINRSHQAVLSYNNKLNRDSLPNRESK